MTELTLRLGPLLPTYGESGFMCLIEGIIDEAGHVVIPFRNWTIFKLDTRIV